MKMNSNSKSTAIEEYVKKYQEKKKKNVDGLDKLIARHKHLNGVGLGNVLNIAMSNINNVIFMSNVIDNNKSEKNSKLLSNIPKGNNLLTIVINLLKEISSINNINVILSKKESKTVQTDVKNLTVDYYEKESFSLEKKVIEMKKKSEVTEAELKTEINILREKLSHYEEENFLLKYKELLKEHDKLKREFDSLNEEFLQVTRDLENKKEYIWQLETCIRNEEEIYNTSNRGSVVSKDQSFIRKLIEKDILSSVTKFLEPIETINLKHTDKSMFTHIESQPVIQKQILSNSIKQKNKIIEELRFNLSNSSDFDFYNEDYKGNIPIDQLMTKYNPRYEERNLNSERNRREMGNIIFKAIDYHNGDINYYMSLRQTPNENFSHNKNLNSTLFSSFLGGYMNKVVNQVFKKPNENYPNVNIYNSSFASTKMNSESKENSLISSPEIQFFNFDKIEHNFNFSSPLELKNLISNCFFRLCEINNTTYLKSFIDEITNLYANLLFFSIEIMKELSELRMVKNSLYEYAHNLKEEKRFILKENYDLVKKINSVSFVNEVIQEDRREIRESLNELEQENKILKSNKEVMTMENTKIKEKYNLLESEYFEMKIIYRKENFNLGTDLSYMIKERDESVDQLRKIKDFFVGIGG